jgi:hypothetical protein
MKALLQAGPSGQVPVPPEKRFLITNISQRCGRTLKTDPANGHILDDPDAMKLWTREYEPGWEPKV